MATYTTKQQKAVLDCLSERADSPVSAAAIVDALRGVGQCPSTGVSAARTSRVMDLILRGEA